jgi:hypothetical protein
MTPSESKKYDFWKRILPEKKVSVTDYFFDIGGNTLLAVIVFSRIMSTFNIKFGLRVFFINSDIKELAEFIQLMTLKSCTATPSESSENIDTTIINSVI